MVLLCLPQLPNCKDQFVITFTAVLTYLPDSVCLEHWQFIFLYLPILLFLHFTSFARFIGFVLTDEKLVLECVQYLKLEFEICV